MNMSDDLPQCNCEDIELPLEPLKAEEQKRFAETVHLMVEGDDD
jgi:hypothetical protein